MKKVNVVGKIPESSIILNNFGKVNYFDVYKVTTEKVGTVDTLINKLFSTPTWVDFLMKTRDRIVNVFGLKSNKGKSIKLYYPVGSKAAFFTVVDRNENEIVMAEDDKHLNFRTSVLVDKTTVQTTIYLTTIVHFNNIFERLYFLPVKPFHRLIVKSLLRQIINKNSKQSS